MSGVSVQRSVGCSVLAAAAILTACGAVPTPVLSTLSPDRQFSATASFLLTVRGSDFQSDSTVVFNNQAKATTFVSAGELSCTITSSDMAVTPGTGQIVTVPVHVTTPGAAASNSLNFSIALYPEFPAAIKIADSTSAYSDTLRPLVQIDDARQVYVVWRDQADLIFSLSSDGGTGWSEPKTIHRAQASSYPFSFARSAGTLLVAWEEDAVISAIRSLDAGRTWTSPEALTDAATTSAASPGIFVDPSGNIFLACLGSSPRGGGPYSVIVLRSSDHGASFVEVGRIPWHTYFTGETGPQIGMDRAGALSLVFPSELGTRYSTSYLASSTDSGRSWSTPSRVDLVAPSLAVDGQDAINVVGSNMYLPYTYRLTFMRSTDRGGSWTSHEFEGVGYSTSGIVVNSFGSTDVVWANRFVRSFDRGSTWGPAVAYADVTEADRPSLVEDASGKVYIAWWDTRGGIYFTASRR